MTAVVKPEQHVQEYKDRMILDSDIRDHMPFMYETAMSYKPVYIIELGTRSGNSTAAFMAAAAQQEGYILSIDIDAVHVPEWWTRCGFWTFVQANDLDPALLEDAHHFMPKCDILFIDTSHAYMHTLRELEAWVPFVRPGGTVLLHDTEYDPQPVEVGGVPQPKWPVSVALSEYCGARGLKWENHTGCNGLGVIRIPGGPCP